MCWEEKILHLSPLFLTSFHCNFKLVHSETIKVPFQFNSRAKKKLCLFWLASFTFLFLESAAHTQAERNGERDVRRLRENLRRLADGQKSDLELSTESIKSNQKNWLSKFNKTEVENLTNSHFLPPKKLGREAGIDASRSHPLSGGGVASSTNSAANNEPYNQNYITFKIRQYFNEPNELLPWNFNVNVNDNDDDNNFSDVQRW